MKKVYIKIWLIIIAIVLFLAIIMWDACKTETAKFNLSELENGIFVYQETVVSRVPAYNYSMATVCNESGNVFTIKGSVNVVYTNTEKPYAVLETCNLVNEDKITVYVPKGTVQYMGTSTVR